MRVGSGQTASEGQVKLDGPVRVGSDWADRVRLGSGRTGLDRLDRSVQDLIIGHAEWPRSVCTRSNNRSLPSGLPLPPWTLG